MQHNKQASTIASFQPLLHTASQLYILIIVKVDMQMHAIVLMNAAMDHF